MVNSLDYTKRDLLISISKLYFIDGLTQQELADRFSISRSNVSKYLKMARHENIVEIRINDTSSIGMKYQNDLVSRFNLSGAIVVSSETEEELTKEKTARTAADLLPTLIAENMKIGLTIGTTVFNVVKHLKAYDRQQNLEVVELIGGRGYLDLSIEGIDIALTLAKKLKASAHILQAPFIVKNENLASLLKEEPEIDRVLKLTEEVDLALFGIGSIHYEDTAYYQKGLLSEAELQRYIEQGAAGLLCGRMLRDDGKPFESDIDRRVIGLELANLKRIPVKVCVASGLKKVHGILGALRGSYIDYLVTDEDTAMQIISLSKT
jgi:deoxyribonucleoside regulator